MRLPSCPLASCLSELLNRRLLAPNVVENHTLMEVQVVPVTPCGNESCMRASSTYVSPPLCPAP